MAVVRGTPRTARLATASSHSRRVRIVDAAKTTAYCCRNLVFVKSTFAVSFTASLSLSMVQEAASAQPLAREARGSRVEVGSREGDPPEDPPEESPSQICRACPDRRSQLLEDLVGVGVGEGAAAARVASSTAAVCAVATAAVTLSARRWLTGIGEASVLLDGLGHFVSAGGLVVAGDGRGAVLLGLGHDLPVPVGPLELHGGGEPAVRHGVGRVLPGESEQAAAPDLDGRVVVGGRGDLGADRARTRDERGARRGRAVLGQADGLAQFG